MNELKISLLFALPSISIIIVAGFFESVTMATVVIILIIINYIVYHFSGEIILKWYNSKKMNTIEFMELYSIVDELSIEAKVSKPNLCVFKFPLPTMFTAGTGDRIYITVSTKALDMLDKNELETLFAHEIGHIKNRDVPLSTVVALFAGILISLTTVAMWGSRLMLLGQKYDSEPSLINFFVMCLVAPPAAIAVQLTIPYTREYAADEVSMILTNKPNILAETLERIERYPQFQPVEMINLGHIHLFPTPLLRIENIYDVHTSMFHTHPDIQSREKNLSWKSLRTSKNQTLYETSEIMNENKYMKQWNKAMFFSFISYCLVLFGIIVIDIFTKKYFDFELISRIVVVGYAAVVVLLMFIAITVFRMKLDNVYGETNSS